MLHNIGFYGRKHISFTDSEMESFKSSHLFA